jgi:hypothetical protein
LVVVEVHPCWASAVAAEHRWSETAAAEEEAHRWSGTVGEEVHHCSALAVQVAAKQSGLEQESLWQKQDYP